MVCICLECFTGRGLEREESVKDIFTRPYDCGLKLADLWKGMVNFMEKIKTKA